MSAASARVRSQAFASPARPAQLISRACPHQGGDAAEPELPRSALLDDAGSSDEGGGSPLGCLPGTGDRLPGRPASSSTAAAQLRARVPPARPPPVEKGNRLPRSGPACPSAIAAADSRAWGVVWPFSARVRSQVIASPARPVWVISWAAESRAVVSPASAACCLEAIAASVARWR